MPINPWGLGSNGTDQHSGWLRVLDDITELVEEDKQSYIKGCFVLCGEVEVCGELVIDG